MNLIMSGSEIYFPKRKDVFLVLFYWICIASDVILTVI